MMKSDPEEKPKTYQLEKLEGAGGDRLALRQTPDRIRVLGFAKDKLVVFRLAELAEVGGTGFQIGGAQLDLLDFQVLERGQLVLLREHDRGLEKVKKVTKPTQGRAVTTPKVSDFGLPDFRTPNISMRHK